MQLVKSLNYNTQENEKDFFTVIYNRVTTPSGLDSLLIQPAIKGLKWVKWGGGTLIAPLSHLLKGLNYSAQGIYSLDLPYQLGKTCLGVYLIGKALLTKDFSGLKVRTAEFVKDSSSSGTLIAQLLLIASDERIISLSKKVISVLDRIGIFGLSLFLLKTLHSIRCDADALLASNCSSSQYQYHLVRLVMNVAFASLCIIGLTAFIAGAPLVAEWIVLSIGTAAILTSIFSYIYGEMKGLRKKEE